MRGSSRKEDQNGQLYPLTCQDGDSDSFFSGSPSKSSVSEGITKDSDPEDLMKKGEPETFIIPSRKSMSGNSAASSAESESNEDVQARNRSYSDAIIENVKRQPAESRKIHEHKNAMVDRNSSTIQIQCTRKDQDSEIMVAKLSRHYLLRISGGESVASLMQHDEGESRFSVSGLIAFSGSIAYSGSLSLRSDCSATSAS